jgi:hypothetical protein
MGGVSKEPPMPTANAATKSALSRSQFAALMFAAAEGSVGPGCDVRHFGEPRVRIATLLSLAKAGLVTPIAGRCDDYGWCKITDAGVERLIQETEKLSAFGWTVLDVRRWTDASFRRQETEHARTYRSGCPLGCELCLARGFRAQVAS